MHMQIWNSQYRFHPTPTCGRFREELGELANAYAELQGNLHTEKKLKMEAEALPLQIFVRSLSYSDIDVPNGFAFVGFIRDSYPIGVIASALRLPNMSSPHGRGMVAETGMIIRLGYQLSSCCSTFHNEWKALGERHLKEVDPPEGHCFL